MQFGKVLGMVAGAAVAVGAVSIGVSLVVSGGEPTERSTVVRKTEPVLTPMVQQCPPPTLPTSLVPGEAPSGRLCGRPMGSPPDIVHLTVQPEAAG